MLLLLLLGSIWLVVASITIALAVAAAQGDAMNAAIPPSRPAELKICRSCHAVINRRPAGEECPVCGHGMVASPARAAFARIPS